MTETSREREARIKKIFDEDTAGSVMKVLRDEGLYRHLLFKVPGTSFGWYELHTAPNLLTFNGDYGTFVFSRIDDMFQFFRGNINPRYWGEKMITGAPITEYEPDRFVEAVTEHFDDHADYYNVTGDAKTVLWEAIEDEVLDEKDYEETARQALNDFHHGDFRFEDTWEWDFHEYQTQYLWALHAIVDGIRRYKRVQAAVV